MSPTPLATVGDVLLRIESGRSVKTKERPAQPGEVGILKVSAVTWGAFRPGENKAVLDGHEPGICPRPRRGDVLISRANTRELVGAPVIVEDDFPNLLLSDKILRLVPDDRRVEGRYLARALRSAAARAHFEGRAGGTSGSMTNITQDDIRSVPVPLPTLKEQRRIADILDKADAIRRKRKEAIALTEELLRSTFLEMFGDPVTNPKGWPVKPLAELGELDRGRSRHRPRNAPALLGGRHPLIQTGEVANCDGVIREFEQTYSDLGLAQSKMWPAGTLCITIAANIAKTGVLAFAACFPDSVVAFTPGTDATTEYVQYWLGFLQPVLERQAPQVAQKNINLEILRTLGAPTPPLKVQQAFARIVAKIREGRAVMRSAALSAEALSVSLASGAFSGTLSVPKG